MTNLDLALSDVDFNPFAPEYDRDPTPTWRALRNRGRIHWWTAGRCWLVCRYREVFSLVRDPRLSLRYTDWEYAPPARPVEEQSEYEILMANGLFGLDHADHLRVRKLASHAFTPRAIEAQRGALQQIVDDYTDDIGSADTFDFATQLANLVPLRTISRLVGVPEDSDDVFRALALGIVRGSHPHLTPEQRAEITAGVPAGLDLLRTLVAQRRAKPIDDFFGALVQAEDDGDTLGEWEMLALVASLLAAGTDTTSHMLTFLMLNLLRRPDVLARVRADASLIPAAMHETLRCDSFGKIGQTRFAREDFELCGQHIRKGQLLYLMFGCAQLDDEGFANPDAFDLDRDYDFNILFGAGPHFCIGAALARLQVEIVMRTVFERFDHLELAADPVFGHHPFLRQIDHLPLKTS